MSFRSCEQCHQTCLPWYAPAMSYYNKVVEMYCLSHCSQEFANCRTSVSTAKANMHQLPSCLLHNWSGGAITILMYTSSCHHSVCYQGFELYTRSTFSSPLALTGLGARLASNCLHDIIIIICDAVLRIMSLILSSHAWLILMLWYINSSQLVTLGLLLCNAHIKQHYTMLSV